MKNGKEKVFYNRVTHKDYDRRCTRTYMQIYFTSSRSIDDLIEGCINNKVGYDTQQIADNIKGELLTLKDRGYTHTVDSSFAEQECQLEWQHYTNPEGNPDGYCEVQINVGNKYRQIKKNIKLVNKINTAIDKKYDFCICYALTPEQTESALDSMRNSQAYDIVKLGEFGFYRAYKS